MIDDRDRALLTLLQEDADLPLLDLADRVALSPSAVSRRIVRLRETGYIQRRVARLDRQRINLPTTVFALVKAARHSATWVEEFRTALAGIEEIVEVHRLTGQFDYILKIVVPNVERYDDVYKRLIGRVELFDVSAAISMETMKQETVLPTSYAV
ncbi:MAG: Lrp/AsnC family transcriptional regulator [Acetobacteraceae bacterium]